MSVYSDNRNEVQKIKGPVQVKSPSHGGLEWAELQLGGEKPQLQEIC